MSKELKMQFQNKCIGLTDDHRDYIYGTDWKGYAKALEKRLDDLGEYVVHSSIKCELTDSTLEMSRRKKSGYVPSCTCGLDNLLND